MEKRFFLGLGILLVFLVLGFLVSWGMEEVTRPVSQMLEQAEEAVLSGDIKGGAELARRAKEIWESGWNVMALAADHSPMDEIDGLLAQIDYYAQEENRVELGACCARVAQLVEAVSEAHAFTWWNLL